MLLRLHTVPPVSSSNLSLYTRAHRAHRCLLVGVHHCLRRTVAALLCSEAKHTQNCRASHHYTRNGASRITVTRIAVDPKKPRWARHRTVTHDVR